LLAGEAWASTWSTSRPVPEAESIVGGLGSAREKDAFANMPGARRQDAFLSWWTAKEALVKALGEGIAMPPPNMFVLPTAGWRGRAGGCDWLVAEDPGTGAGLHRRGGRRRYPPQLTVRIWESRSA
jgi:hypothetical protein